MKLTKSRIKTLKPGKHGDGRNLWLFVTPSGSTTWAFLYTFGGNRREKWLKSYEAMSIEQARDEAVRLRNLIRDGRDPLEEEGRKATPKRLNTFEAVAERAVASFVEGMTNATAKDQWMSALRT